MCIVPAPKAIKLAQSQLNHAKTNKSQVKALFMVQGMG